MANKEKYRDETLPGDVEPEEAVGESSEYSPKAEFKKPFLVQEAVKKCMDARAKEMRPGYENTTKSPDGTILKNIIPDSREEFINSVKALTMLLAPEIEKDKLASAKLKEVKETDKKLYNQCIYRERKAFYIPGKGLEIRKGTLGYMPKMSAYLTTDSYDYDKRTIVSAKGFWDNMVAYYWENLVNVYDELLEELSKLLDRLNYFKPSQEW